MTTPSIYIAGDCLPGLLDGWCGPIEMEADGNGIYYEGSVFDHWVHLPGDPRAYMTCNHPTRLDLRRAEVRDRVARVLANLLEIPVGSTAPALVYYKDVTAPDWYITNDDGDERVYFDKFKVPDLGEVELDGKDCMAQAMASVARWVGENVKAGRSPKEGA